MKVSVIIPCFNHGEYIDEAVDSILNQTYQDFEIIIIDDGSTDSLTIEKLKNYNKPKTKVIRTENNGLPAARNKGIRYAKGQYILTLDADDKFAPAFLNKAVGILASNPKIGVVTCYAQLFGSHNAIWRPKGGGIMEFLAENNCCASSLFRKVCWEQVNGYDQDFVDGYEDWEFWIKITGKNWLIHAIKEPLFYYRVTSSSMYKQSEKISDELVKKIVQKNKKLYQRYLEYVISEKERKIREIQEDMKKDMKRIFNSRGWKIISFFHKLRIKVPILKNL